MLTQKVRRDWHQPTVVVLKRQGQGTGPGECADLDRSFASVAMISDTPWETPPGAFITKGSGIVPNYYPFPGVPYTCLDPTKTIVVEFDYVFSDSAPTDDSTFSVEIQKAGDPSSGVVGSGTLPPGGAGHATLTFDPGSQSVFTSSHLDPGNLKISVDVSASWPSTTGMTVNHVAIRFNQ